MLDQPFQPLKLKDSIFVVHLAKDVTKAAKYNAKFGNIQFKGRSKFL